MNVETVTVLRAADRPRRGEVAPAERHHDVTGCIIAPQESAEIATYSTTTVTAWELYAPPGADILPTDQVECRGLVWDVVGEPSEWRSPFSSWRPGIRVVLTRTRG